jgi:lipoprotein-anchoring transpeptidase ErfK/SrfK
MGHIDRDEKSVELEMISRKTVSRVVVAAGAAVLAAAALSQTAAAENQVSYLWGGDAESGGRRHTVDFSPQFKPGQVVVSFGDRRLYLVTRPGQALSYPIAIPREQSRWEGVTSVSMKRENPSWTPTEEMLRENPRLPSWVPGGHPLNPLGVRALYLGSSTYRIHGTDAPWTIGQAVSKGCIRMYNEDVADLYPRVPVGARVTVTWQRFNHSPAPAVASNDRPDDQDRGRQAESRWADGRWPHDRYFALE